MSTYTVNTRPKAKKINTAKEKRKERPGPNPRHGQTRPLLARGQPSRHIAALICPYAAEDLRLPALDSVLRPALFAGATPL